MGFIALFSNETRDLIWSTLFGNTNTEINDIAENANGEIFITGKKPTNNFPIFPLDSTDFPVLQNGGGTADAFGAKFAPYPNCSLKWSTPLGGSGEDIGKGIAIENGNIYIIGSTKSSNFPYRNNNNSESINDSTLNGSQDGFISVISDTGIIHSTYIGGNNNDQLNRIIVGQFGNKFIIGQSNSPDLHPVHLPNSYFSEQLENNTDTGKGFDAIVFGFNADWDYVMSFYFGGERYSPTGHSEASVNSDEEGNGIAVFSNQTLYIAGSTASKVFFPTTTDYYNFPNAWFQNQNFIDILWPNASIPSDVIWDGFLAQFDLSITPLSIKSFNQFAKTDLKIFPNPSPHQINIWFDGLFGNKQKVKINNLFGQCLFEETYNESKTFRKIIKIDNLSKGMYIVTFISENLSISGKLIIE
jgi:hypothetical protein